MRWPLEDYVVTRDFFYEATIYVGGQHAALDLVRETVTTLGSPIFAVGSGTVIGVGWDMYSGFFVAIDHAGGWRTFYRHLYGQSPVVVGQVVAQDQVIGNVGSTGWSTGPHLHFDLWHRERYDGTAFYKNGWYAHDPILYLGQEEDSMPDPIYVSPKGERAQRGAAGKSVIGMNEDVDGLIAAGAEVIPVSQMLFDAIPVAPTLPEIQAMINAATSKIIETLKDHAS